MKKTTCYGAKHSFSSLEPYIIDRRDLGPKDINIEILFCGVCHSDVHQVKNEWHNTVYPCVPGHEIIGRVVEIGADVRKFKMGEIVGVGPIIDSCQQCENCNSNLEQYCKKGFIGAYNGNTRFPAKDNLTFGGYSSAIVIKEDYVIKIPTDLDPASIAPLLCAGSTTYSPLKFWKVTKGSKVAIVGFGGLGHIAIKLAIALGADVSLITTSPEKTEDAKKLGVSNIINSKNDEEMENNKDSFDFILSTIPESHDANPYITLLKRDGALCIVGCIVPLKKPLDMSKMILDRKKSLHH